MCDKSWKVCPEHSNEVADMSLYNSIYYTESVTTIIHDLNYIQFMQKILYVYTYTCIIQVKRRDNCHDVSKSIDCKLFNDLQYVDIVLMRLCFYQVDSVHHI